MDRNGFRVVPGYNDKVIFRDGVPATVLPAGFVSQAEISRTIDQLQGGLQALARAGQTSAKALRALRKPLREAELAMRHHRLSRGARRHLRRQKAARG